MLVKASILLLCLCVFQGAHSILVTTSPPPTYPPCDLNCQNNGSCVFYSSDFLGAYCYCPTNYTGELCQTPQELCSGYVCHNGGMCYNGTCVCPYPFSGPSCCEYPCNMSCMNNGTCRRNTQSNFTEYCECPYGYSGAYCELTQEVCGNYICHNGGTCQDGICSCPPPYTGADCRAECGIICENNGQCVYNNRYNVSYCNCEPGFTGERCEVEREVCGTRMYYGGSRPGFEQGDGYYGQEQYNFCYNNGTCYNGSCVCEEPFSGPSCCSYNCSLMCQNGGECQLGLYDNSEYCECPHGYAGLYCEQAQEVCGNYICHNGGTCQGGICSCPPPYTGADCRAECGIICENNGQCVYNNRYNVSYCNCEPGFTGERCEVEREVCGTRMYYGGSRPGFEQGDGYYGQEQYNFCYNNGTCYNGSCVCEEPFSGPSCCSYNCSLMCQNGGECQLGLYDNSEYCECPHGYAGLYCEQALETCGQYLCLNNGTCQNGTCSCPYPYTGADCAFRTCDLQCVNNGSCLAYMDHQFCVCPYPYFGEFCQFPQEVRVSFEENEYEAMEGGTANVTVTVDGFFTVPFNVTVMPGDGTAIAPGDYNNTPVTVTFEPSGTNNRVAIATIDINDDFDVELMENFFVTLYTPQATEELTVLPGTPNMAQVIILDNDRPSCPPDTVESIMWPRTDGGQTATQPCVCVASQSNLASRPCGSDGQWGEPDLTLCVFSSVVQNLCPTVNVGEQIEALTNISMVENLEVTNGDILLLTESVGEVIDGGPINSSTARVLVAVLDEVVEALDGDMVNADFGEMVLEILDRVADAFPMIENGMPVVQMEENVVVEVVDRMQNALQQNGLTTTQLGGGNMVELPAALFSLPSIPAIPRFTAVSIDNRNLVPPRTRNNLLRSNIISVNLNVPGGLRNLRNDQRIRLTFDRDTNTNDAANGAISCVFYDTQDNDWSSEGCEMVLEDTETVTCECNHLTAFSILQSPAVPTTSAQPVALVVTLSVVGVVVLLVLAVTGGAYLIWRSRRKSQADVKLGEL